MKDALLALLEIIAGNISTIGLNNNSAYITSGIAAFGSVHSLCIRVARNVCQPVAYSLLAIFLLIDLIQVTMNLSQQGGGGMAAPVAVLKTIIKLAVCKWAIGSSATILSAVFRVVSSITSGIDSSHGITMTDYTEAMRSTIEASEFGIFDGLVSMLVLLFTVVITWAAILIVTYVLLSRYVQIYFYLALSPIPMAFFAEQHTTQMGVGYLKGFAGVSLQATVIALAVRLFPAFANAIPLTSNNISGYCLRLMMLCFILIGTIVGSSQVANRVFGG